ncbi:MAG: hypothetical protein M1482_06660 [Chloroflexi bacterium]|nr:hypothetical protein [Chloroflexota bacterium]
MKRFGIPIGIIASIALILVSGWLGYATGEVLFVRSITPLVPAGDSDGSG